MGLNLRALIFHRNNKKEGRRSAYRQTCFWVSQSHSRVSQSTHMYATFVCFRHMLTTFFMCFQTKKMGTMVGQKSSQVVGKKKTLHLPYLSTRPRRFLLPWNTQELRWDPTILLLWESIVHLAFPGDNNRLSCLSEVIARTSWENTNQGKRAPNHQQNRFFSECIWQNDGYKLHCFAVLTKCMCC